MYKTASVSTYKRQIATKLIEGQDSRDPHSGWFFLQDDNSTHDLFPFKQDRFYVIQNTSSSSHMVYFIPVVETPITSNKYYIIMANKQHKGCGLLVTCEKGWSLTRFTQGPKLKKLCNSQDSQAQEFTITQQGTNQFKARSHEEYTLPKFLEGTWSVEEQAPFITLQEAKGLKNNSCLPDGQFEGLPDETSAIEIGRCYSPFVFIEEPMWTPRRQLEESPVYKGTLKRYWKRVDYEGYRGENRHKITIERDENLEKTSTVEVSEERVTVKQVSGSFKLLKGTGDISMVVSRHLKEAVVGRNESKKAQGRSIVREFDKQDQPGRISAYVLAERYTMKRGDGSIVFTRTTVDNTHSFTITNPQ